ncbi:MAG: bifunctional metallophosphatase/5'-nucleotidase [Prevotella sp.]|jgi:5'-nucleotidase
MRKIIFKLFFSFALVFSATAGFAQKTLTILHTNDTHSCIYPLGKTLSDTSIAGRGGFLRRIAMLKEERAKDPDLLLFDSGDFSQGSPYYTLFKGDVEIGLMNQMGYVCSTIGNHEFDFGIDNMARIFKKANFPILCSNYDFTGTPLKDIVKPYTIIKRKGVKIGIFALDPKLEGLVFSKNYEPIKFLDPIASANKWAKFLKVDKKCDVVILVSHLGWNILGVDDQEVIANSRYIDLVLGGHSHTYFQHLEYQKNLDGKLVPVDQNGKNAVWVGKITLQLEKKK